MEICSRDSFSIVLQLIRDGMFSVDEQGVIWRHKIRTKWGYRDVHTRRADHILPIGYRYLSVTINRRQMAIPAHRLVWHILCGPIPPRMEVNHIDGNRSNNHPSNLELVTSSENKRHSYHVLGHKKQTAYKWGPEMQAEVLSLRGSGLSYRQIERQTGVSAAAARHIIGQTFSHQSRRGENDVRAVEVLLCNQPIEARNGQRVLFGEQEA